MSYPTRRQSTTSTQSSLTSTTNTYSFSSSAVAGNMLVVCLAGDKNTGTLSVSDNISGSTGWTVETAITGASVSLYVARKVAVGGETTITATTSSAPSTGNSGYAEEMVDDGSGAWTVVAKATPVYNNDAVNSTNSGTTDTADYDGRALAIGVIDSLSSIIDDEAQSGSLPTFTNFTKINAPAWPSGSGGGNAGCFVGEATLAKGATTSTTFATNAGSDQLTAAIVAFGRVEATGPAPADLYDLSRWHLTLPTEDPGPDTDAAQIDQPELDTYQDANFYVDTDSMMVFEAPVEGSTTSGASGATRCELREHEAGSYDNSAWDPFGLGRRQLTITTHADATSITGGSNPRKEMIIAQIHGAGDSPIPLILAAEYHVATPRVRIFLNGPGFDNPVLGITPTTPITIRIRVQSGEVQLWAIAGQVEDLSATPNYTWPVSGTFSDTTGWYFKYGSYNKTQIGTGATGKAVARVSYSELLQPGDPDPTPATHPGAFLPFFG